MYLVFNLFYIDIVFLKMYLYIYSLEDYKVIVFK